MRLYIIRHGETEWNRLGKIQGKTNIDLSENGRLLARRTAEALKNIDFDFIFSSPLRRAYETAHILKLDREAKIQTDERIAEVGFGPYEGRRIEERTGNLANFFDDPIHYEAKGSAESYDEILERAASFLDEKIFPLEKENKNANILISGHGAINRALALHLLGTKLEDIWKGVWHGNCAVDLFEIFNGKAVLLEEAKYFYKGE